MLGIGIMSLIKNNKNGVFVRLESTTELKNFRDLNMEEQLNKIDTVLKIRKLDKLSDCFFVVYAPISGDKDGRVEVDIYYYDYTNIPPSLMLVDIEGVFVDLGSTTVKYLSAFSALPENQKLEIIKNNIISIGKVFDKINKCFFVVYSLDSAKMELAYIYEYIAPRLVQMGYRHEIFNKKPSNALKKALEKARAIVQARANEQATPGGKRHTKHHNRRRRKQKSTRRHTKRR